VRHIRSVLFDLYDTLTYVDKQCSEQKVQACARILEVQPSEFSKAWTSLVIDSNLGKFPQTEDRVRAVIRMLNVSEVRTSIDAVVRHEHQFLKQGVLLFDDTVSTLLSLRKYGLKLGIVTNASPSVNVVLKNHRLGKYMDCVVISSEVGFRKPDAMIYKIALERLGAQAQDCVFVGDGNDKELDGAHKLGIATILVKRNIAKYMQMEESSLENVDFTVCSLTEIIDILRSLGALDAESKNFTA
jgi:putative hydrolase of the HAD superfamily